MVTITKVPLQWGFTGLELAEVLASDQTGTRHADDGNSEGNRQAVSPAATGQQVNVVSHRIAQIARC
jgi:hypothetical protein